MLHPTRRRISKKYYLICDSFKNLVALLQFRFTLIFKQITL